MLTERACSAIERSTRACRSLGGDLRNTVLILEYLVLSKNFESDDEFESSSQDFS